MSTDNLAAVLRRPGEIVLEERAVPGLGPDDVLVRIRAVGVCGSDVHYFEHGRIADFVVESPLVLGHEASGVIVEAGTRVADLRPGQRVALEPGVGCRRCPACRSGRYNLCPDVRFFGTPPVDGAFTRYVAHPQDYAFAVPDSVSDDAAALLEPFSVGLWATRRARLAPGESVLVTGAGPIGLCALLAARAAGAGEVVVTDVNPARLDVARRLGATAVLDVRTEPLGQARLDAHVLLECSGVPAVAGEALAALRPAGRAVFVGMGADALSLPLPLVQSRELVVTGTFRYANTYPAAIALAAQGQVDLDALVTGHLPLERTADALRVGARDPHAVKTIVTP